MLLPLLLATIAAPVAADQRAVRLACSEEGSQAVMADCLRRRVAESEAALRAATARAVARIDGWDEDALYKAAARAALTATPVAFRRYREAQCALAASLSGGGAGNAREMQRLACVHQLNAERAAGIDSLTGDLPAR